MNPASSASSPGSSSRAWIEHSAGPPDSIAAWISSGVSFAPHSSQRSPIRSRLDSSRLITASLPGAARLQGSESAEETGGAASAWSSPDVAAEALQIANDTIYGLGAGVWTRDGSRAFRMGRAIQAGHVWTNCYHQYPAHAPFGGYKVSGVGCENHRMMLEHYSQTKCLLVSYDPNPLGFF
jgi:hypothetical protein